MTNVLLWMVVHVVQVIPAPSLGASTLADLTSAPQIAVAIGSAVAWVLRVFQELAAVPFPGTQSGCHYDTRNVSSSAAPKMMPTQNAGLRFIASSLSDCTKLDVSLWVAPRLHSFQLVGVKRCMEIRPDTKRLTGFVVLNFHDLLEHS